MKFNRLRLTNWKCYEKEDVSFDTGITVVHGVNGAGKSTLLEACYFALYGTDAFPSGKSREDAITTGMTELEVELWFTHSGIEYRMYRRISNPPSSDYVYSDVEFETPTEIYEKESDVQREIQRIMRMDATAFLNCSYVRQGDITRLIHAAPSDRQNIIDRLLQLGKLETYRERMEIACRGARNARDTKSDKLQASEKRIEELEEQDLDTELAQVNEQLSMVNETIDHIDDTLETAETRRDDAQEELDGFDQKQSELDDVTSELNTAEDKHDEAKKRVSELRERHTEAETELESARTAVVDARESVAISLGVTFDEEVATDAIDRTELHDALDETETALTELTEQMERLQSTIETMEHDAEMCTDRAKDLRSHAAEADEREESLTSRAEKRHEEDLADKQARKAELTEHIETTTARFDADDVPDDVEFGDADAYSERISTDLSTAKQERTRLNGDIDNIHEQIDHAESLIEKGRCPECGQDIDGAPMITQLDEKREKKDALVSDLAAIEDRIEDLIANKSVAEELQETEAAVAQDERDLETVNERIDEIEHDIERLERDAESKRETAAEKRTVAERWDVRATRLNAERAALEERLTEVEIEQSEVADEQHHFEQLEETLDIYLDAYDDRETATELLAGARETAETHESRVTRLSKQKDDLEEAIDEDRISTLEETIEETQQQIEQLTADRSENASERDRLHARKGEIQGKRSDLEDEREQAARLRRQQATLTDAVAQLEDIDQMYGGLRETLREANVSYLEQLLNDIFGLIYENDAYAYIELNRNYEIIVHEKGGETLAPDELSGGEQALFNLALRCAIYQLLAEGIDGEAPLPPLILDEPTVHLDEMHVGRINDLAERMRQLGVDQTIVVSHSREIVDAADERIAVTQDASTNRSQATIESTDLLAGL